MAYRQFVKENFHNAEGRTPQEKMQSLGKMWKTEKVRGSGVLDLLEKQLPSDVWNTVGKFSDQRVPDYLREKLRELDQKKPTAQLVPYTALSESGPYHAQVARFDTLMPPDEVRGKVFGWFKDPQVTSLASLPKQVREMLNSYTSKFEKAKAKRDALKSAADDFDEHEQEGGGLRPKRKGKPLRGRLGKPQNARLNPRT